MVCSKTLSFFLLTSTALAGAIVPRGFLNKRCGETIDTGSFSFPNCWGDCASDPACGGGGAPPPAPADPAPAPPPPPPPAPAAPSDSGSGSSSGSDSGSGGSGDANTDMVNKYRAIMGKGSLSFDGTLSNNINKCLNDSPGQMVHELISPSMGQTLAGGDCGNFEDALVHGWICEIPSLLPDGMCNGGATNYMLTETGHAQILSDNDYTKVACACNQGIWGCDFGM